MRPSRPSTISLVRPGGIISLCRTVLAVIVLSTASDAISAPPFSGTAFIAPNLVTSADPTAFVALVDKGMGSRMVFDRRVGDYVTMDMFLYDATYADGDVIEFQVNPEFGDAAASREPAAFYAPILGRMPAVLRRHLAYTWIHRGDQPFGGTPFDGEHPAVLIHTGSLAQSYINQGVLEEILIHEATHAVLDVRVRDTPAWIAAQAADGEFISTYARDNPTSEDVAESFVPYLAVCCGQDRVPAATRDTIAATISARLRAFDALLLDVRPLQDPAVLFREGFDF